jgi:hypothetical protein
MVARPPHSFQQPIGGGLGYIVTAAEPNNAVVYYIIEYVVRVLDAPKATVEPHYLPIPKPNCLSKGINLETVWVFPVQRAVGRINPFVQKNTNRRAMMY